METKVSIIVATYNRKESLGSLILSIENQKTKKHKIELVITDDGSDDPVTLKDLSISRETDIKLIRQKNKGQASARNKAIRKSTGDIIVIIDDDMTPCENFIQKHIEQIISGNDVCFGRIENTEKIKLPSFEKYHLNSLQKKYRKYRSGVKPLGTSLCTGNVSFTREIFEQSGGFDESLKRSEDRDLGIKFQVNGANFGFINEAITTHNTDHRSAENWRKKAKLYGIFDAKIAEKHSNEKWASPWNFIADSSPIFIVFILQISLPKKIPGKKYSLQILDLITGSEKSGKVGHLFSSLIYPSSYISGVLSYYGKRKSATLFLHHRLEHIKTPLEELKNRIKQDFQHSAEKTLKYKNIHTSKKKLLINKAGLQILVIFRLIQFLNSIKLPNSAKILSRMIRFIYGSDIHPLTDIEGGVSFVHGFGIVTSSKTKIKKGSIIFHNVTLGMGRDIQSGAIGSPIIGENVHIGPGASITGPITIGNNTKISSGVVINQNVPENSVILQATPRTQQKHERKNRTDNIRQRESQ